MVKKKLSKVYDMKEIKILDEREQAPPNAEVFDFDKCNIVVLSEVPEEWRTQIRSELEFIINMITGNLALNQLEGKRLIKEILGVT